MPLLERNLISLACRGKIWICPTEIINYHDRINNWKILINLLQCLPSLLLYISQHWTAICCCLWTLGHDWLTSTTIVNQLKISLSAMQLNLLLMLLSLSCFEVVIGKYCYCTCRAPVREEREEIRHGKREITAGSTQTGDGDLTADLGLVTGGQVCIYYRLAHPD